MDEPIYAILKLQFDFASEVRFSILLVSLLLSFFIISINDRPKCIHVCFLFHATKIG